MTDRTTYQTATQVRGSGDAADVLQHVLQVRAPFLTQRPAVLQAAVHMRGSLITPVFPTVFQEALQSRQSFSTDRTVYQAGLYVRAVVPILQSNISTAQPEHGVNGWELNGEAMNESRAWADIIPDAVSTAEVYRPFVHRPNSDVFEEVCDVEEDRADEILAEDRDVVLDPKGECE